MISRDAGWATAKFGQHLLIIAGVQLVLRFQLRELQIIVAGFFEISGMHAGVAEQFVKLGDVRAVPGFL